VQFQRNETIYSRTRFRRSLGILLTGKAEVRKSGSGDGALLTRLTAPGLFGAASLFVDGGEYVSEITALQPCSILFLPQDLLTECMRRDFILVENYLCFLSERVRFLNGKIDGFTQASAESRLAWYLLDISEGNEAADVPVSLKSLANVLNLGRASLYRALEALTEAGMIEREGKRIRILDKAGLQSVCR
jgi:CRP-like cAMP-binding protein